MDFTLTEELSMRTLSRALQTASKLTDHVQFTSHTQSVHLRLLTATHSTYAVFKFDNAFFSSLEFPASAPSCKVSSRLMFPLLKSPQTVSMLRLQSADNVLRLTISTQSGLTKRFRIPCVDGRVSSIRPTPTPHVLRSSALFLNTLLSNFHIKLEEITLIASQESIKMVSFVDDVTDPSNAFLRTEITVDAAQFDHHLYGGDDHSEFTFLCRPFRTVIEFCAAVDVPISLRYDKPGAPLCLDVAVLSPLGEPHFEANFVFSSRAVPGTDLTYQPQYSQPQPNSPAHSSPRRPPPSRHALRPLHIQPYTHGSAFSNPHASSAVRSSPQVSPSQTPDEDGSDEYVPSSYPVGQEEDDYVDGTPPP